jgi:5-bromo-4-chloroindolyl phosphate hydrolysis protein
LKKNILLEIVIGLFSGGAFLLTLLLLKLDLWVSLLITGGLYVGFSLVFKPKKDELINITLSDIDPIYLKDVTKEANEKIAEIASIAKSIKETKQFYSKIKKVLTNAEAIVADFKQDPRDIKLARNFFNYYLDATIRILKSYRDIVKYDHLDQKSKETLLKVEKMIEQIGIAFEKQLNKLLENDVMDLDVEITLLENMLKMEGWNE